MDKGKFIVFEGGDGSGKSTILDMVYDVFVIALFIIAFVPQFSMLLVK